MSRRSADAVVAGDGVFSVLRRGRGDAPPVNDAEGVEKWSKLFCLKKDTILYWDVSQAPAARADIDDDVEESRRRCCT